MFSLIYRIEMQQKINNVSP